MLARFINTVLTKLIQKTSASWRIFNFFSRILPTPETTVRKTKIKAIIPLHQQGVLDTFKTWESREPETLDWIDSFTPKSIFFDIGASFGTETLYAALKWNGPQKIISFDIDLLASHNLACNIALNNITNVENYFLPLWSEQAFIPFEEPTQYQGAHMSNNTKIQFNLYALSLDEFINRRNISPNYIKIDVDGAEVKLIEGMKETLTSSDLKSVLIEVSHKSAGPVTSLLTEAGLSETTGQRVAPGQNTTVNLIFSR